MTLYLSRGIVGDSAHTRIQSDELLSRSASLGPRALIHLAKITMSFVSRMLLIFLSGSERKTANIKRHSGQLLYLLPIVFKVPSERIGSLSRGLLVPGGERKLCRRTSKALHDVQKSIPFREIQLEGLYGFILSFVSGRVRVLSSWRLKA